MRISRAAVLIALFVGGADGFLQGQLTRTKSFGVTKSFTPLSMSDADAAEPALAKRDIRGAISGLNTDNFSVTVEQIETFLLNNEDSGFNSKTIKRLSDKAWTLGLTLPEGYGREEAAPAAEPVAETEAEEIPEDTTEEEEETDVTPEPVAEEETSAEEAVPVEEPVAETVESEEETAPAEETVAEVEAPAAEVEAEAPAAEEKEAVKITPKLIKELRDMTGAGMMDCKKALTATNGDIEEAIENMRTSGALKAAKKATKTAAEGQIIIKTNDGTAAMVEVNCQTDFVAKDETFLAFANSVADAAVESKASIEDLKAKFEEDRVALVAKIGENINIRRVQYVEGVQSATYLHNGGKIGVVVAGEGDDTTLKNLCMHVCASSPQFLTPEDVSEEVVEKERRVQIEIAMNAGKPQEIAEKMVTGRMKKFTGEVSLTGQPFVMDPKKSVGEVLKESGSSVTSFVRLEVGEGIEKKEEPSFADEVAAMAGTKKEEEAPAAEPEAPAAEPVAEVEAPAAEVEAEAPAAEEKEAVKITPKLIKELRDMTGAGMMDCKKALTATNGDIEEAIENMRTSGALKAAKKATKTAAEGQIIIRTKDGTAAMVEVNCQTDFVAKDETFLAFANGVADAAVESKASVEDLKAMFEEDRVALVAKIGENINIRRVQYVEGVQSATYLHNGGKIGVVVAGEGDDTTLKNLCMHVCASSPQFLTPEDVSEEVVEKERRVQIEIAMNAGKPQEIAEKMVTGRMKKFTGEVSLTGQPFVMDPKKSVGEVLKESGSSVTSFVRLEVGEGIEKKEEPSFADEVAAMAGTKKEEAPAAEPETPAAEPVAEVEAPAAEVEAEAPAAEEKAAVKITPKLIKELRDMTGAGMMDCKKALTATNGDIEEAIENMRTSGALKAAKKATKTAAEGQIIIRTKDGTAAMVEVNCQTDFVAKDETFLAFANGVADAAVESKASVEDLKAKFEEDRVALVAKIGENINIRRVQYVEGVQSATYLHNGGKIGVVVAGEGDDTTLKNLCMHVCASSPQFLTPEDVSEEVVEKERRVQIEIAMNAGKPQEIAEKMVTGRMKKFTGEVSLTGQPFVMDPKKSVGEVLKESGSSVTSFVRLEVGEGIEKKEEPSFAEEVAAMAGAA